MLAEKRLLLQYHRPCHHLYGLEELHVTTLAITERRIFSFSLAAKDDYGLCETYMVNRSLMSIIL
jgi:hypothetical protein